MSFFVFVFKQFFFSRFRRTLILPAFNFGSAFCHDSHIRAQSIYTSHWKIGERLCPQCERKTVHSHTLRYTWDCAHFVVVVVVCRFSIFFNSIRYNSLLLFHFAIYQTRFASSRLFGCFSFLLFLFECNYSKHSFVRCSVVVLFFFSVRTNNICLDVARSTSNSITNALPLSNRIIKFIGITFFTQFQCNRRTLFPLTVRSHKNWITGWREKKQSTHKKILKDAATNQTEVRKQCA